MKRQGRGEFERPSVPDQPDSLTIQKQVQQPLTSARTGQRRLTLTRQHGAVDRQQPLAARTQRILLFDEIEKAHADIFHVFLQILDDARLTDNRGLTVSFRDAIILMTTNIGTGHFLAETDFAVAQDLAIADLDDHYRPEFLARFNGKRNVVCFRTLDLPVIEKIAERDIQRLNDMVRQSLPDVTVTIGPAALEAMCRDHYRPITGARGITGYIEGVIKPEIANTVLFNTDARGDIEVSYDEKRKAVIVSLPDDARSSAAQ